MCVCVSMNVFVYVWVWVCECMALGAFNAQWFKIARLAYNLQLDVHI